MKEIVQCVQEVRLKNPLVQAITNYVTINDCANILLAAGASPAMCESVEESFEFAKIANALYLNIGTFHKEQELAMLLGMRGAALNSIPVVVDPVGCGAIPRRIDYLEKLWEFGNIAVIKGNLGEIKALARVKTRVKGVDSLDEGTDGLEVCRELAKKKDCIIAATGEKDIVTDGDRVALIENGTPMFTRITGAGCMLGALTAGFCGADDDMLAATVAAHAFMGIAGELAEKRPGGQAPGTFKVAFMDQIYLMDENNIMTWGRIKWL